jgi:hypothetical protein
MLHVELWDMEATAPPDGESEAHAFEVCRAAWGVSREARGVDAPLALALMRAHALRDRWSWPSRGRPSPSAERRCSRIN